MKTVQYRRSRPSTLAVAFALLLTMLFVYAAAGSSKPPADTAQTTAEAAASAEIRMEGLKCFFITEGSYADAQEAHIAAAMCAENGGAGMIYESGGEYHVVRETVSSGDDDRALKVSVSGLTMEVEGSAKEITVLSEAVDFLYAQAHETGGLAGMLENGNADQSTLLALLSVYRTQARNLLRTLDRMTENRAVLVADAVKACAARLEDTINAPDMGKFRLIHTAACAEWISLLETIKLSA